MYQAAIHALLGLQRRADTITIDPCIPTAWNEFTLDWRIETTLYRIVVQNPEHRSSGIRSATLDGVPVTAGAIPLVKDGREHDVRVILGAAARTDAPAVPRMTEPSGVRGMGRPGGELIITRWRCGADIAGRVSRRIQ